MLGTRDNIGISNSVSSIIKNNYMFNYRKDNNNNHYKSIIDEFEEECKFEIVKKGKLIDAAVMFINLILPTQCNCKLLREAATVITRCIVPFNGQVNKYLVDDKG